MRIRDLPIAAKIIGVTLVTLALTAVAVIFFFLPRVEDGFMDYRTRQTRRLVEAAHSLVASRYAAFERGELTEEQAKVRAMADVGVLRYRGDNYFWINDLSAVMLMHPANPELIGRDLSGLTDPDGVRFVAAFARVAREDGAGFVYYHWPKPGEDKPQPKAAYVKLFEPWGWVIGTGIYVDDVAPEIMNYRLRFLAIGGVVTLLATLLAALMARNITAPIVRATRAAQHLARGDLEVSLGVEGERDRRDEGGRLLAAMGEMVRTRRELAEAAEAVAQGDLSTDFAPASEADVLGQSLGHMLDALRGQIAAITEGIGVLAASSARISTSVRQLVASSSETGASMVQVTAMVEEVRQTARVSTDKAQSVSQAVRENAAAADAGLESSRAAREDMALLAASMQSIGALVARLDEHGANADAIIELVNDLADQINVLAVNAAIEAAKADQAGAGFGVVAAEMRALAEQSKKATIEVRANLTAIREASGMAAKAARGGSGAMSRGLGRVEKVDEAIEGLAATMAEAAGSAVIIASSSREQLTGLDQMVMAVTTVKEASEQNLAATTQLETETRNLEGLGRRLKELASRYRLRANPTHYEG